MKLKSIVSYLLIICCFFNFTVKATNDSLKKINILLNTGYVCNRAFSHIERHSSYMGHNSSEQKTPIGDGKNLLPGFSFGLDAIFGLQKSKINFLLGLNYSNTQSHYHFSSNSNGNTTSSYPYNYINYRSEIEVATTYNFLNCEMALRNKLFENFYLRNSILFSWLIKSVEKQNGYIYKYEYSNPAYTAQNYNNVTYSDLNSVIYSFNRNASFSYRIGLSYKFKLKNQTYWFYGFRNFGVFYTLPWWGIGASVSIY